MVPNVVQRCSGKIIHDRILNEHANTDHDSLHAQVTGKLTLLIAMSNEHLN